MSRRCGKQKEKNQVRKSLSFLRSDRAGAGGARLAFSVYKRYSLLYNPGRSQGCCVIKTRLRGAERLNPLPDMDNAIVGRLSETLLCGSLRDLRALIYSRHLEKVSGDILLQIALRELPSRSIFIQLRGRARKNNSQISISGENAYFRCLRSSRRCEDLKLREDC